jgi:hypothetical protein
MNTTLAFLLDGPAPLEYWKTQVQLLERQLFLSVCIPAIATFISWLLIRWRRKAVGVALLLAVVAAVAVIVPAQELKDWGYPEPGFWPSKVMPWLAATVPFLAIVGIYFQKKPNQTPEPTAPSGRGSS